MSYDEQYEHETCAACRCYEQERDELRTRIAELEVTNRQFQSYIDTLKNCNATETVRLEEQVAEMRGSLRKYADEKLWCCMDHMARDCPFCDASDFIMYDGEDSSEPGWKLADESLKKAGGEA